jgi:hypothetical protein
MPLTEHRSPKLQNAIRQYPSIIEDIGFWIDGSPIAKGERVSTDLLDGPPDVDNDVAEFEEAFDFFGGVADVMKAVARGCVG